MEQTVYGDLLFFVNFCMDFQCLFLTARLLRRRFFMGRALIAAAFGALYACVALFVIVNGVAALVLDLAVCALMCLFAYAERERPLRTSLLPFALYFGVSAAVGGVMSGIASLLSRLDLSQVVSGEEVSSGAFLLISAAGGALTFLFARLCQRRGNGTRATLTLQLLGKRISVTGLVDTANLLADPVCGRPVVILREETARAWVREAFPPKGERDTSYMAALPPRLARRARLVPASTVTGEGLMLTYLPDAAWLDTGRGARSVELLVSAATLASLPTDCAALLPAAILTE